MRTKHIYILLTTCVLLASCGSKKTISTRTSTPAITSKAEAIEGALKASPNFETLSAKASLTFQKTGGQSASTSSQLRIVRGKTILLSVRPMLGIEVARIVFTPDSVLIIDRFNKRFMHESVANIKQSKQIDFNYNNLEALFTARLFLPGKADISKDDYSQFSYEQTADGYALTTADQAKTIYRFLLNEAGNLHSVSTTMGNKNSMQCTYGEYVTDEENRSLPTNLQITIKGQSKTTNIGIALSKIAFNEEITTETNVPSSYQKVSLEQVISMLSKLL